MNRQEEIERQTAIRRQLLSNGYTPLANKDKMCILPGWSTIEVDEEMIEGWSDALKYRATGVRLDNGLVMIDFDIDDADAMLEIMQSIPDHLWEVLQHCPVRRGKGAKEAWFARAERPFMRWASAGFIHPGHVEQAEPPLQRLEVFGGASARQAGVYGAHTIGADGSVKIEYTWLDERGLCEVPFEDLPLVTERQIEQLCRHVNEELARLGWKRFLRSEGGKTDVYEVFDLTEDMIFVTAEGAMTFAELTDAVSLGPVRCSASWLEGPTAVNVTRCIASARHDGTLQILETAAYQLHRPESAGSRPVTESAAEKLARLAAKASEGAGIFKPVDPPAPTGGEPEMGGDDAFEAIVRHLLDSYAFCSTDSRTPIYPLDGTAPLTMANFKGKYAPYVLVEVGPKGGVTETHPVSIWYKHPDRVDLAGAAYMPWSKDRLVWNDDLGGQALNTYRPPVHGEPGAGYELWEAFLTHLLPDAGERAWLVNKLAAKAQKPAVPGVATLLVASQQGTGRGTLFQIIEGLFGGRNCITLDRNKLFGTEGQAQYTDWRANRLVGFVHELLVGDGGASLHHRRQEMYEHLKIVAEPESQTFDVVEKFKGTRSAVSHLSLMMATNHRNALPLEPNDRRIAVLTCGDTKLDDVPALQALHKLKRDPAFLAMVWDELLGVAVDWDQVMRPPMTAGRAAMIEANVSDLDGIVMDVLEELPGDIITMGALRERINRRLRSAGIDDRNWQNRVLNLLSNPYNPTGWVYHPDRITIQRESDRWDKLPKVRVVARETRVRGVGPGSAFEAFKAADPKARAAMMRAEDPNAKLSAALQKAQERGIRPVE
ncbi:DNA primase/polymerase [Nostoc phage Nsp-JY18]